MEIKSNIQIENERIMNWIDNQTYVTLQTKWLTEPLDHELFKTDKISEYFIKVINEKEEKLSSKNLEHLKSRFKYLYPDEIYKALPKRIAIEAGSEYGNRLEFTSDKFSGVLVCTLPGLIWLTMVISRQEGKGNVRQFIHDLHIKGYTVKAPDPFPKMEKILKSMGFTMTAEVDFEGTDHEVWHSNW